MLTTLVTGCAGFIGFHVSQALLGRGEKVIGIDNLNSYYDVSLKKTRLQILKKHSRFAFRKIDIAERNQLTKIFKQNKITRVCHLAAQAGVRYSFTHPEAYIRSNEVGFFNVIHEAALKRVRNFVYASSSSVYGGNTKMPFSIKDQVDQPLSLYAATKKANELTAHTYSHLYNLPTTGLRFFTVYGPYGRPDMALFLFTKAILEGKAIDVYNYGKMKRNFTYIDDIVSGILAALDSPSKYAVYNIGNDKTVELTEFIRLIEVGLGRKAKKRLLPLQPGDVPVTWADISHTKRELGYSPQTDVKEGVRRFLCWYKDYYHVK